MATPSPRHRRNSQERYQPPRRPEEKLNWADEAENMQLRLENMKIGEAITNGQSVRGVGQDHRQKTRPGAGRGRGRGWAREYNSRHYEEGHDDRYHGKQNNNFSNGNSQNYDDYEGPHSLGQLPDLRNELRRVDSAPLPATNFDLRQELDYNRTNNDFHESNEQQFVNGNRRGNNQRGNHRNSFIGRNQYENTSKYNSQESINQNRPESRGQKGNQKNAYRGRGQYDNPSRYNSQESINQNRPESRGQKGNQKNAHRGRGQYDNPSRYNSQESINQNRTENTKYEGNQRNALEGKDQYNNYNSYNSQESIHQNKKENREEQHRKKKNDRNRNKNQREEGGQNKLPRPKKNTENFNPCHDPPPMRLLVATPGLTKYNRQNTTRDVIIVSDLFGDPSDMTIYNKLLHEIHDSGVPEQQLWQLWHGDSHVIADDKRKWKDYCPTFYEVLDKLSHYFDMDIKATRFNWYRNTTEWKPFHHDAAALKPDKARTQNITVGVSFGCERDAAFEHAETKTVISMPQPNGMVYTFGRDVNILWRHGILQVPPEQYREEGRISIIAWGWVPQVEL